MEIFLKFFPLYFLGGALAGTLAGLLGIGGGLVIVPLLTFLLPLSGVAENLAMHMAVATSLAVIVITSLFSVRVHHKYGTILWPVIKGLLPGLLLGSLLGTLIADFFSQKMLQLGFGLFTLLLAMFMLLGISVEPNRELPGRLGLSLAGGLISSIGAMLGMGGGAMAVSYFTHCNVSIRCAISTATCCGLPVALVGSLSFIYLGHNNVDLPTGSIGYIYLPAFFGIALATSIFVPLGARLTHRLPKKLLRRLFAGFLVIIAAKMLWS